MHAAWLEPKSYGADIWESYPEHTAPCTNLLLELVGGIDENTGYFEAIVHKTPVPIRPVRIIRPVNAPVESDEKAA